MFEKVLGWIGKRSVSPAGEVSPQDAVKALRTAAITAVAMAVLQFIGDATKIDYGPYGMLALPLLSGAADYVRRMLKDNSEKW